ncbi:hypothetical protein BX616_009645 [Lobosporangium transversale]|uniref:K Homology domain-containing protein n=1 Tax=Lobosporangium transversale TaxID=64571 RepID=A0A1Y2GLB4_9FUNG|nr:hypothetical protein BCR41DRAFT_371175 [Lobosporangium transversale]KAF9913752.1 hypothetical protein BX616_009645 [Lobosporangium transversale]ORZ14340.1 hypothetical protein BCR41DRAFT_371175 [Lobosporangium transversale]|eukprot:XP_021880818.1 hypothetical protein BCR41DRAFT_371175 [Lobosporangium transversale]
MNRPHDQPSTAIDQQPIIGSEEALKPGSIPTTVASAGTSIVQGDLITDIDTQNQTLMMLPTAKKSKQDSGTQNESGAESTALDGKVISAQSKQNSSPSSSTTHLPMVRPQFKASVDEISATTRTSITLLSSSAHTTSSGHSPVAGYSRQDIVELQVTGSWENAEAARLLLLVAIDTLKPGIIAEKLTVELKYQNMIGGRKRQDIQELMAKTNTSIYLTSPLVQTANKSGAPVDTRYNDIYITGESKQVAIAKDTLSSAYHRAQAMSISCTRQVNIATRKLDWMMLNHREKLRGIMIDNATFIAFPPLGGTHFTISVYGESNVNVERTIRTVMQLSCHFHSGSITMRDLGPSINFPQMLPSLANICKHVSQTSGSEVEYRNNGFSVFGSETQIRMAMQILTEMEMVKALHSEFKFSVELANEHREFISGKKNGKINRIMKATGAKIKFDQCNEYNFYVDLSSGIAVKAMEALVLLQEELPAEISFFVPEAYHKRIIGVGGKNIQRIMKKYGVYVKFSNSEEFATLGGYFDNLDNVVARTPSKNAINLENLKQGVMEFVNAKDKDFVSHRLLIPKQQHLPLLCSQAVALREIYEATNATILFPARETGSDIVVVFGPESLIQQAITMLLSMVNERYALSVKSSDAMYAVLALPEFKSQVVDEMKRAWNMTLIIPQNNNAGSGQVQQFIDQNDVPTSLPSPSSTATENVEVEFIAQNGVSSGTSKVHRSNIDSKAAKELHLSKISNEDKSNKPQHDHVFIFEYTRNNEDYLKDAKDLLIRFLASHQIEVYNDELKVPRLRSSSFGETFIPLHDRVISLTTNDSTTQSTPDYVLFDTTTSANESISCSSGAIGGPFLGTGDIRSLFTPSTASSLLTLDTSPPRRPDHSRHLGALPGSPSTHSPNASVSGTTFGLSQSPSSVKPYSRTTSLPADPWTPNKHQQRQLQSSTGYLGSIGELRSTVPGYYSPGGYSQPQQACVSASDLTFSKAPGFQISPASSHRYSSGDSPVHGPINTMPTLGNFVNHASPQRSSSQRSSIGFSNNWSSLQYLEEKPITGMTFGPGYGPSLNGGNGRASHQQQINFQQQSSLYGYQQQSPSFHTYTQAQQAQQAQQTQQAQSQQQQQQQQGLSSQPYASHIHPQPSIPYPQHRQRHSSQNSAASHHTMGLGPLGCGPNSTGGSVNSDEFSTEEDSDEVFDEMRNRQKMQSSSSSLFQPSHVIQPGHHQNILGSGYEGYSSHNSSSSSLLNRRGSAGSTHSISLHHHQQQQQQLYGPKALDCSSNLSSANLDLYIQNPLVNAMEKHSINNQSESDMNVNGGRTSQGRIGQASNRQSSGIGLPSFLAGSRFEDDRSGFFANGFGGIIGEDAHGYGHVNGSFSGPAQFLHGNHFGTTTHSSALESIGGAGDSNGLINDYRAGGHTVSTSHLFLESPLHHGQAIDRTAEVDHIARWDR